MRYGSGRKVAAVRIFVIVMLVDVLARFASLCSGACVALSFLPSVWSFVSRNQCKHVFEYLLLKDIQLLLRTVLNFISLLDDSAGHTMK